MTKNIKKNSLGYAIGRTNWLLKTLLNQHLKEEGFNITNEQWLVLKVISANPAVSQTEVAEKSLKDKTNITRILDLLEKYSYIERRRDDSDRRMNRVHITEQGEKVLLAVKPVTKKIDKICSHSLNKIQTKALIESLNAICLGIKNKL